MSHVSNPGYYFWGFHVWHEVIPRHPEWAFSPQDAYCGHGGIEPAVSQTLWPLEYPACYCRVGAAARETSALLSPWPLPSEPSFVPPHFIWLSLLSHHIFIIVVRPWLRCHAQFVTTRSCLPWQRGGPQPWCQERWVLSPSRPSIEGGLRGFLPSLRMNGYHHPITHHIPFF